MRFLRVPLQEEHDQLSPCDGRLQLLSRKGQAMLRLGVIERCLCFYTVRRAYDLGLSKLQTCIDIVAFSYEGSFVHSKCLRNLLVCMGK